MMAKHPLVIAITGPESTGKSTLLESLSACLPHSSKVAEYARHYLEERRRLEASNAAEVHLMWQHQWMQLNEALAHPIHYVLMDTDDLVHAIWIDEKFANTPTKPLPWVTRIDFTLLCKPDLPWAADPLRVNPLDRDRLFEMYFEKLMALRRPFAVVEGNGEWRLHSALRALLHHGLIASAGQASTFQ